MYKKILFVSPLYPTTETPEYCIFIHQQVKELKKIGNKVDVIVPIYSRKKKIRISKEFFDNINIIYVDFPVFYFGMLSNILIEYFIYAVNKKIDFEEYDIISIHMFDEHLLKAFIKICKRKHIKIIAHFHGLNVAYKQEIGILKRFLQKKGNSVYKKLLSLVDSIVGVSDKVCEQIRKEYNNYNCTTVYNGVDIQKFYPSEELTNNEEITIVSVGNLIPTKGHKYLLSAFSELVNKYSNKNINLKIIGKGPLKEELIKLTKELRIDSKVEFTGGLEYKEVAVNIRNSDIFILPSYYEALGCVYLEAMASKVITIGCLNQGIEEIIIDGENGFLVNEKDTKSIYDTLEYIIENNKDVEGIARNGLELVKEKYTWNQSAKLLDKLYENILKG